MPEGDTMAGRLFARFPFPSSRLLRHPRSSREESPEPWAAEPAWSLTRCMVWVVNTVTGWWLRYLRAGRKRC